MAGAARLWCTTCGAYVVPGSHGIHVSNYGRGASVESAPPPQASSLRAVLLVVAFLAVFAGFGFGVLYVAFPSFHR